MHRFFLPQKHSRKLRHARENVCMVVNEDRGIYAVGSQSYITVIDDRISKDMLTVPSQQIGAGLDFKWPSCLLLELKL